MDLDDKQFMETALELAEKGAGFTSPNPLVGAVVVKNDKIVGRGFHKAAGKAHAEVNAINEAGDLSQNADLYVTLEPCNHTGRTPPCTEKILNSGIKRVVVAMEDPNPNVTGKGNDYLKSKGLQVETGICKKEAEKQNEIFIKYIKTGKPFVIVKCAATLDGRIATRTGESRWISNTESRKFVHMLRHKVDAIMVGIDTVTQDNPQLTTRLEALTTTDPVRIILDTHLKISIEAAVLNLKSDANTIIVTGDTVIEEKRKAIEGNGAKVIAAPVVEGLIDLKELMTILGKMEITSLLIEGGSKVITSAINSGIVDKIHFFYAPKISGGDDGIPICTGKGPDSMNGCINVKDITTHRFGDDIMIEGYIN